LLFLPLRRAVHAAGASARQGCLVFARPLWSAVACYRFRSGSLLPSDATPPLGVKVRLIDGCAALFCAPGSAGVPARQGGRRSTPPPEGGSRLLSRVGLLPRPGRAGTIPLANCLPPPCSQDCRTADASPGCPLGGSCALPPNMRTGVLTQAILRALSAFPIRQRYRPRPPSQAGADARAPRGTAPHLQRELNDPASLPHSCRPVALGSLPCQVHFGYHDLK
jgi:hypothetical protein